jgi:hypothetical protein
VRFKQHAKILATEKNREFWLFGLKVQAAATDLMLSQLEGVMGGPGVLLAVVSPRA